MREPRRIPLVAAQVGLEPHVSPEDILIIREENLNFTGLIEAGLARMMRRRGNGRPEIAILAFRHRYDLSGEHGKFLSLREVGEVVGRSPQHVRMMVARCFYYIRLEIEARRIHERRETEARRLRWGEP